jgi:hypothetical protein
MSTLVGSGYPTGYPNILYSKIEAEIDACRDERPSGDEKVEK